MLMYWEEKKPIYGISMLVRWFDEKTEIFFFQV